MFYNYGTSGFRFHHTEILKISKRIGRAVCILSNRHGRNYGIMITASHNHHEDNGVKLLTHNGYMISTEEEMFVENFVNATNTNEPELSTFSENNKTIIHIGYDSRESSPKVFLEIQKGCIEFGMPVVNHGYLSTPELHYILHTNTDIESYLKHLKSLLSYIQPGSCTIDCANGIGSKVCKSISGNEKKLILKNTDWETPTKLNDQCSSDFVCTFRKEPFPANTLYMLGASLDGDADRSVFFSRKLTLDDDEFALFDGDDMSALIALYIITLLRGHPKYGQLSIGFIYTGYTNGACVEYVRSIDPSIRTICTATGVKHLHEEAEKYDIGIYFEQNGHGNVVFREGIEYNYPELKTIKQFFHPCIGDGIMNVFAVLFILKELNMNANSWRKLYHKNHCRLLKLHVQDKHLFKPVANELELISPPSLQTFIFEQVQSRSKTRTFVRPSGTENVVRLYVESESMFHMNKTLQGVLWKLVSKYHVHTFQSQGKSFTISHIQQEDMNIRFLELLSQLTFVGIDVIGNETYLKEVYECLNQTNMIFVVKHDDVMIGAGTLLIEQKVIHRLGYVGHIEDVVVDKTYREYGIGKQLILHLNNLSKMMQGYKCILDCSNENVGFYEKCGFKKAGSCMSAYI